MEIEDKIRLFREANRIERCHMIPHQRPYSVGQHSQDMVGLLILTWRAEHNGALPPPDLIIAAVFHDTPERKIGDIPSQIKTMLDSEKIKQAEDKILTSLDVNFHLFEEERRWLDWCDKLELLLWAWEEVNQIRNQAALKLLREVDNWSENQGKNKWPPVFTQIWNYYKNSPILRLSENLKELDDGYVKGIDD